MNDFTSIMNFLTRLEKNNNREWFNDNKSEFETAKGEFIKFISYLISEMEQFDNTIIGIDAKKSMYRIYKDIRFSKDKTPYKTHFGAYICKGGRTSGNPGYYVHIEPNGNSIIGGGLYHPMPNVLAKIRQEIDYNGDKLIKILDKPSFNNRVSLYKEDKLQRKPKGYEEDNPYIELLKLKSFLVMENMSDKEVLSKEYANKVISGFKEMVPFVGFLNEGLS